MSSNSILQAYKTSLKDYTDRQVIISAATPLEFSRRDGTLYDTFTLKVGNSSVDTYYEDNRAEDERQFLDIMSFVETAGTHTERDNKYKVMLDMTDQVRAWIKNLDNATIDNNLYFTRYVGIINTVDDQDGFYAMIQRIEFECKQQLYT